MEQTGESASAKKSDSLAVYYHRPVLCVRVVVHHVAHAPPELEERVGEGIGVARPLRVVEQDHRSHFVVLEQEQDGTKKCGTMCMEQCGTMGPRGESTEGALISISHRPNDFEFAEAEGGKSHANASLVR